MDADLRSIQEARDLVARAAQAQRAFATASQEQVDRVVGAMAAAASRAAEPLARLAVDETRMGVYEHKVIKNRFASDLLLEYILPMRTVGVLREDPVRRVRELAVPMGVVGAIVPTTNPTSTAIYKALISVKARNAIVMSPHPRAVRCTVEAGRLLEEAACSAGAPPGLVNVMTTPSLEGTNALMRHRDTAVLLATGGSDMVKAVYTAGKPAYGVGPGNVPSIIERTADLAKAVADVVDGKTFDAGVLCSSENSVVVDAPVAARVRALFVAERAHFCSAGEKQALERFMIPPTGKGINPDVVGQSPVEIARRAGFEVPAHTKLLIVELARVGREDPLSREKLCPVLGFFVEDGWERCCERAIELLRYGGIGHSLGIHSQDRTVIERFFQEKPAYRIIVNSNTAIGAVGYTTGFAPALTLGPGSWGGSITSDNITPMHLLNIKRMGEELRPYRDPLRDRDRSAVASALSPLPSPARASAVESSPRAAALDVSRIVDDFMATFRAGRA
ncbi:MAG: aldehyde dehydrogenase family protein [Gemmatimonadaceae bacterium]|nr:aldehyde dehydrogenase family protein [Gemmatimonadaceae bacterium]